MKAVWSSQGAISTMASPGSATCTALIGLMHGTTHQHPQKFADPAVFTRPGRGPVWRATPVSSGGEGGLERGIRRQELIEADDVQ